MMLLCTHACTIGYVCLLHLLLLHSALLPCVCRFPIPCTLLLVANAKCCSSTLLARSAPEHVPIAAMYNKILNSGGRIPSLASSHKQSAPRPTFLLRHFRRPPRRHQLLPRKLLRPPRPHPTLARWLLLRWNPLSCSAYPAFNLNLRTRRWQGWSNAHRAPTRSSGLCLCMACLFCIASSKAHPS